MKKSDEIVKKKSQTFVKKATKSDKLEKESHKLVKKNDQK